MVFVFSIIFFIIRVICIPVSDYPDFQSVAPEFISRIGPIGESLFGKLTDQTHCDTVPSDLLKSYILGSVYKCQLAFPPASYLLIAFLLWLIFSILLLLVTQASSKVDKSAKATINKMIFFTFAIPSTFYYILNVHTDIPYSILAILLVSSTLAAIITGKKPSKFKILLFLTSYILIIFSFPENQALIVAAIYLLVFISSNYLVSFGMFSDIIKSTTIQFRGFLASRLIIAKVFFSTTIIFSISAFIIYRINLVILGFLSGIGIPIISFVAMHYTEYYVDVSNKYPLLIRLFGLLQTSLLRTPSNFGVSIVSFSLFLVAIFIGMLRLFSCSNRPGIERIKSMILLSIPSIIFVVAILPGFSNYKYYVGFTPLIAICMSFSYRISLISIFFVYSEIIVRSSLSGSF